MLKINSKFLHGSKTRGFLIIINYFNGLSIKIFKTSTNRDISQGIWLHILKFVRICYVFNDGTEIKIIPTLTENVFEKNLT